MRVRVRRSASGGGSGSGGVGGCDGVVHALREARAECAAADLDIGGPELTDTRVITPEGRQDLPRDGPPPLDGEAALGALHGERDRAVCAHELPAHSQRRVGRARARDEAHSSLDVGARPVTHNGPDAAGGERGETRDDGVGGVGRDAHVNRPLCCRRHLCGCETGVAARRDGKPAAAKGLVSRPTECEQIDHRICEVARLVRLSDVAHLDLEEAVERRVPE
mmetsp:Transcript_19080/g.45238  ORF Transcript_19080/g.45238 Transcript_19080/m.45238 type:complete len:222 (+) Transcript_19080:688-1353(+)